VLVILVSGFGTWSMLNQQDTAQATALQPANVGLSIGRGPTEADVGLTIEANNG
jgi:hypothetical protein